MLTKEEYLEYLDEEAEFFGEGYRAIRKLIIEHFELTEEFDNVFRQLEYAVNQNCDLLREIESLKNPQPYKFEDLKPNMWIWDDRTKSCMKIRKTFVKDVVNTLTGNIRKEHRIKFKWGESVYEENRFYPVQKANEGNDETD